MNKVLLAFMLSCSCLSAVSAQEGRIRVRYNENSQKLVVNQPDYIVLSYDMYLYPANSNAVIGPCTVDYNVDEPEKLMAFYDRVHPGDKVKMKNIKVLNMKTHKAQMVADYSIELR